MTKTRKGDNKEFRWTCGANKRFETLQEKVVKFHVLVFPDFTKVFQIDSDASGSAIGVILSQDGKSIDFYSGMILRGNI